MDIKGKIVHRSDVQQVSETFTKRFIAVEVTDGNYTQEIKIEAFKEKTSLFDDTPEGTEVEVFFNLNGKSWTNKAGVKDWFNSLVAWKINVLTSTPVNQAPAPVEDDDSDLPF